MSLWQSRYNASLNLGASFRPGAAGEHGEIVRCIAVRPILHPPIAFKHFSIEQRQRRTATAGAAFAAVTTGSVNA